MKISYKGDYALKALFELAIRYYDDSESVIALSEINAHSDMPIKFLEQILLNLKKGGFVKSKRGINGGFYLARSPADITMGEVVRFMEGPIEPISCIEKENYKGCRDLKTCIFRGVWVDVRNAISVVIDTLTFEELVLRYKEKVVNLKPAHEYSI